MVAATNVELPAAIEEGKFREDLYYRLNTVPIRVLPLRDRKEDIFLLFRKFAQDFAERYRMPPVRLDDEARRVLEDFHWPGNVRQLKNITEQISVIEQERMITGEAMRSYLPMTASSRLPALYKGVDEKTFSSEREILYQVLFDMKKDMNDLKKLVLDLMRDGNHPADFKAENAQLIHNLYNKDSGHFVPEPVPKNPVQFERVNRDDIMDTEEFVEESLSLEDKEIELIRKALEKHKGKRKYAAQELGISERTLYRKIKEYEID